ncbi:unnamed protein product [Acanthoscelides obtectus]|uniref:Uncharacterized protein n=1 Tax=Acanthoscelides obtectus TaxID=200917 RepID=A0A9P0LBQ1_ACAOB|nr:unnamed protein product [Acanthoscelides obtectus]CAK1624084.1 hypothetical protein AOBTE_LOCUS2319 [Acanthoscelides obtectus]
MTNAIITLSMSEMLFHKALWDSGLCRASGYKYRAQKPWSCRITKNEVLQRHEVKSEKLSKIVPRE